MIAHRWTAAALRRCWPDEDGAAAIEFAIVGSILIALCLAILQFGWALQVRNEIAVAADQAVRYLMLTPDASDADFKAQVENRLDDYNPDKLTVTPGEVAVGTATFRTITVRYEFSLSVPGLPADLVELEVSRRTPRL
jgi:Flp pilus assembly protein TadG